MSEEPKKSWALRDLTSKKDVKGGTNSGGINPSLSPQDHVSKHSQGQWTGTRSSNGTTFLRSNFFIFLMGQIVTAGIALGIFLFTSGVNSNKIDSKFDQLFARIGATEAVAKRMDDQGTNFSHYGIAADSQRITNDEVRITQMETDVRKIGVMDSRMERMEQDIKEIKANVKR